MLRIIVLILLTFSSFSYSQDVHIKHSKDHELVYENFNPYTNAYQIESIVTLGANGHPILCQTIDFDKKGRAIKKSMYGNLSGNCHAELIIDDKGKPLQNGIEVFSTHCHYNKKGNLIKQEISSGTTVKTTKRPITSRSLSFSTYAEEKFETAMGTIFGKGFLQFAGYYSGLTTTGVYNEGNNLNEKTRVTVINGILNIYSDMKNILFALSSTHGDVTIHYVFRPTGGWTSDMWNCALVKMGFLSEPALHLATLWKKLIQEMGGTKSGAKIVHYAHSLGATDTYNAIELLTPEERKALHIVTLGAPTLIPDSIGLASVMNYASRRDAICMFDPLGYIRSWSGNETNVKFVGDTYGLPEHSIYTETYQEVLKELGQVFKECNQWFNKPSPP